MDFGTESAIELEYRGRYAILTINRPSKLGALSRMQYYELGQKLREIAEHDEVYVTILVGKGRFFSASVILPTLAGSTAPITSSCLHQLQRY